MTTTKLLPLSGIAFVALVLLTVLGLSPDTPGTNASGTEVAAYYADNEAQAFAATFVFAATVPFLVLFAIALGRVAAPGNGVLWGRFALAGSILAGSAILATSLIHFALADLAAQDGSAGAAFEALNALDGNTWIAYCPGLGVLMLGAAGVLLSANTLRPLAWTALVLGVALFIPYADFVALLVSLLWIVVVGIALARGAGRAEHGIEPLAIAAGA